MKGRSGRKMSKEKFVSKGVFGIHHVIAITSDPQRNIDFYANRRWIIYRLVSAGVILRNFHILFLHTLWKFLTLFHTVWSTFPHEFQTV